MARKFTRWQPVRALKLEARLFNRKIRRRWGNNVIQFGMSALALLMVLLVMDMVLQPRWSSRSPSLSSWCLTAGPRAPVGSSEGIAWR